LIIYKITNNINNKVYIGQTIRDLETRLKEHRRKKHCMMYKAFNKYGYENFTAEVIDTADTIEELNEKEMYWISYYDSTNKDKGYNLCEGGGNTKGYHHTEESKTKMSQNTKKKFGADNHFYGMHHTEETRDKMRQSWIIRKESGEQLPQCRRVVNLDTGEVFSSVSEACEKYNLSVTHVCRVCRGKRKRTGGYRWAYYDDVAANTEPSV
jgi:hypothetical protein